MHCGGAERHTMLLWGCGAAVCSNTGSNEKQQHWVDFQRSFPQILSQMGGAYHLWARWTPATASPSGPTSSTRVTEFQRVSTFALQGFSFFFFGWSSGFLHPISWLESHNPDLKEWAPPTVGGGVVGFHPDYFLPDPDSWLWGWRRGGWGGRKGGEGRWGG